MRRLFVGRLALGDLAREALASGLVVEAGFVEPGVSSDLLDGGALCSVL